MKLYVDIYVCIYIYIYILHKKYIYIALKNGPCKKASFSLYGCKNTAFLQNYIFVKKAAFLINIFL